VPLKPEELQDVTVSTSFFPKLSILCNGRWENAPDRTVAPNAAYIFDPLVVNVSDQHPSFGLIPLHTIHPQHPYKRYWRLQNASLCGILSAVILRSNLSAVTHKDVVRLLYSHLFLMKTPIVSDSGSSDEGSREDVGCGGWRGRKRRIQEQEAEEEGNTRSGRFSTKRGAKAGR
jgi:hypothetical protein